jgi:hypothetical protein
VERIKEYDIMLARGTISAFHEEFKQNAYLETNKFEIILYPPQGFMGSNYTSELATSMTLRAETVNMAGRNISSFDESNIYGPVKQVPDGVTYGEDITVLFIASQNMAERDYIENWQQMIYNAGNWDLNYYNDFIGTLDIYTISKYNDGGEQHKNSNKVSVLDGKKPGSRTSMAYPNIQGPEMVRTFGIRCQEVWPKTLGATELAHNSGSELIKIPVSFAFRYWDRIDTSGGEVALDPFTAARRGVEIGL